MTAADTPTRSAKVHQVLATLGYGDAIGNEVVGIQKVLRRAGFRSEIFVETVDPKLEHLTRDYRDLLDDSAPENILIHHFSIGSRASRVAYALPDRMVLVYHNITPPEYFLGVHHLLIQLCYTGRRELGAYVNRCDLALGDSETNRRELEAMGFAHTGVLPVVPSFDHLDGPPNRMVAGGFDDGWTNLLFVGRTIPNKRFEDLIRTFQAYRLRYNPRSRLLLVGEYGGFGGYLAALYDLIATLGVPNVHFIGHVSNEELTAFYDVADVFLSASEHEGFCVPIAEAFYKRIPVIAYAAAAVPATMDGAGVLYHTKDPRHVAALIDSVVSDQALEEAILSAQDAALGRLLRRDFAGSLLAFIDRVLASPRPPAHAVTWDFWDQFDRSEELEELRQYRPAAYRALPKEPGARDQELGTGDSSASTGDRPAPDDGSRPSGRRHQSPASGSGASGLNPHSPVPSPRPPDAP